MDNSLISLGSNFFADVMFPMAIGNRYIHVGPRMPGGGTMIRVFEWLASERRVVEQLPEDSDLAFTFGPRGTSGTIRLRISDGQVIGYIDGSALNKYLIVVSQHSIEVKRDGKPIVSLASSMFSGCAVGVSLDPETGAVGIASGLPEGFRLRQLHAGGLVRLSALVEADAPLVCDRMFQGCRIDGPAILVLERNVSLHHCRFELFNCPIESLVWARPNDLPPYGTIRVRDVEFADCEIRGVAFAMPPLAVANFLRSLTSTRDV